ncbi:hypothetical protein [Lacrimispora sphenoides]|jgi:hypothetical protein|uniref:hypothetical protein n=1 Tax=Lacrimispora sphenoides TaxID=29370 RepID=UPI000A50FAC8|nr:hypothetical protein [Lacrimispora sphenoides]
MKTIYLKELKLTRKMLMIWLVLIVMLTGFAAIEFIVLKDAMGEIAALAESFPKIILILFGLNGVRIDTPLGAYLLDQPACLLLCGIFRGICRFQRREIRYKRILILKTL